MKFYIGIWILLISCIPVFTQKEYTKFYYPDSTLASEGWMKNDRPDGLWKSYHPNGLLKSVGVRKNHLLDSTWNFYNEQGDLVQTVEYHLGKKNGYLTHYFVETEQPINKGKIKSKELYVNDKKSGTSFYYREDGSIKEKIPYSENKKKGIGYEYNENEIVKTVKHYKNDILIERERINRYDNGLKEGIWMTFFEDGKVKKSMDYHMDQLHGYSKIFDRKGNIVELLLYRHGKLVSNKEEEKLQVVQKKYHEQGKRVNGSFKNGEKIGVHRIYDNDTLVNSYIYNEKGKLMEEGLINEKGIRNGKWIIYYENGNIYATGKYENNRKTGQWQYFYEDESLLQQGNYIDDKTHGNWTWYYPDGDTLRYEEFSRGAENGYYVEYSPDNEIITEGYYIDGEKDGEWYYHAGDIKEKGKYVFGLKEGSWKQYYNNGKLRYEGNYIQGNPDGKHKFYYPDGTLKEEQYYISGYKEGNWKKYDPQGELLLVITYENDQEIKINGKRIELTDQNILNQ